MLLFKRHSLWLPCVLLVFLLSKKMIQFGKASFNEVGGEEIDPPSGDEKKDGNVAINNTENKKTPISLTSVELKGFRDNWHYFIDIIDGTLELKKAVAGCTDEKKCELSILVTRQLKNRYRGLVTGGEKIFREIVKSTKITEAVEYDSTDEEAEEKKGAVSLIEAAIINPYFLIQMWLRLWQEIRLVYKITELTILIVFVEDLNKNYSESNIKALSAGVKALSWIQRVIQKIVPDAENIFDMSVSPNLNTVKFSVGDEKTIKEILVVRTGVCRELYRLTDFTSENLEFNLVGTSHKRIYILPPIDTEDAEVKDDTKIPKDEKKLNLKNFKQAAKERNALENICGAKSNSATRFYRLARKDSPNINEYTLIYHKNKELIIQNPLSLLIILGVTGLTLVLFSFILRRQSRRKLATEDGASDDDEEGEKSQGNGLAKKY